MSIDSPHLNKSLFSSNYRAGSVLGTGFRGTQNQVSALVVHTILGRQIHIWCHVLRRKLEQDERVRMTNRHGVGAGGPLSENDITETHMR